MHGRQNQRLRLLGFRYSFDDFRASRLSAWFSRNLLLGFGKGNPAKIDGTNWDPAVAMLCGLKQSQKKFLSTLRVELEES